jgi:hypothetical protein
MLALPQSQMSAFMMMPRLPLCPPIFMFVDNLLLGRNVFLLLFPPPIPPSTHHKTGLLWTLRYFRCAFSCQARSLRQHWLQVSANL